MVARCGRAAFVVVVALGAAACGSILGITDPVVDGPGDAAVVQPGPDSDEPPPVVRPDAAPDAGDAAAPVADADAADVVKRVFVSSDLTNGIIGGLAGADTICTNAAKRGNLGPSTWVAWLSGDGKNAIDRITHDGPYDMLDGRRVVSQKTELTSGKLQTAIVITEDGTPYQGTTLVWTGTSADGHLFAVCSNWTTNNPVDFGTIGSLDQPHDALWTDNLGPGAGFRNWGCQTSARLYCFEL